MPKGHLQAPARPQGSPYPPPKRCTRGSVDGVLPDLLRPSSGVQFVNIAGFQIRYSTGMGLLAPGSRNVTVRDCHVACIGEKGLLLEGYYNRLLDSVLEHTGCGGASVGGGDMRTLAPGGNVVQATVIRHTGRWKRTYQPGIYFSGVGNAYLNNVLHDSPHQGMTGYGNDHRFIGNTFERLCHETSDASAWYQVCGAGPVRGGGGRPSGPWGARRSRWGAPGVRIDLICQGSSGGSAGSPTPRLRRPDAGVMPPTP